MTNSSQTNQRFMGLDVGNARIGVALSDPTCIIASPRNIIHRNDTDPVGKIVKIIEEESVSTVVVGLPINMDGTKGPQARKTETFADKLRERLLESAGTGRGGVDIQFWDERRSTMTARSMRLERGTKQKKRAADVDAEAAAVILQGFLDARKLLK